MADKQLNHLAVIMDGNGRWAKRQGLDRIIGHAKGAKTAISIVEACVERKISECTLYALSVENMTRDHKEVSFITDLLVKTLIDKKQSLHQHGVRVKIIGNREVLGKAVCQVIDQVEKYTEENNTLRLNIAFNYSGRWQIQQAVMQAAQNASMNSSPQKVFEDFESHLRQEIKSDPDLLIRTGGERRLSNFMLWHLAYTELYFTGALWPDFNEEILDGAIKAFNSRERRFGQVPSTPDANNCLILQSLEK